MLYCGSDFGELGVELGLGVVELASRGFADGGEVDAGDADLAEVGDGVDAVQRLGQSGGGGRRCA
jgi:hypothetical protein